MPNGGNTKKENIDSLEAVGKNASVDHHTVLARNFVHVRLCIDPSGHDRVDISECNEDDDVLEERREDSACPSPTYPSTTSPSLILCIF